MKKELQRKVVKEKQFNSPLNGLIFLHFAIIPVRMEVKTKGGKRSYLNKRQMVSIYKDSKVGKLIFMAGDGRYGEYK